MTDKTGYQGGLNKDKDDRQQKGPGQGQQGGFDKNKTQEKK